MWSRVAMGQMDKHDPRPQSAKEIEVHQKIQEAIEKRNLHRLRLPEYENKKLFLSEFLLNYFTFLESWSV
jgi:hypothetical protein